jgi:hypothetical protein
MALTAAATAFIFSLRVDMFVRSFVGQGVVVLLA